MKPRPFGFAHILGQARCATTRKNFAFAANLRLTAPPHSAIINTLFICNGCKFSTSSGVSRRAMGCLSNSRNFFLSVQKEIRFRTLQAAIITCARKVAFRQRPTFAHTCAYGERVSRRVPLCCETAAARENTLSGALRRAMGCLSNSRNFFLSVQKEIRELYLQESPSGMASASQAAGIA